MVKKKDTLGQIILNYPELGPVLAKAGLHCVGCHVSAYESFEDGCKAHGMSNKDINELVKESNKIVKEVDSSPKVSFTKKALVELVKRMKKEKGKMVRVVPVFDGYDFDVVKEKYEDDIKVNALPIFADKRTERFLRGIKIDYSEKKKDFVAKR